MVAAALCRGQLKRKRAQRAKRPVPGRRPGPSPLPIGSRTLRHFRDPIPEPPALTLRVWHLG